MACFGVHPTVRAYATLAAVLGALVGCKTAGHSDPKDISMQVADVLDEQKWIQSCDMELANPATAAKAKADLNRLAGTADCRKAYPVVRATVLNYIAKP